MAVFRKAYVNVTAQTDIIVVSHEVKKAVADAALAFGIAQVFSPVGTIGIAILENDPKIYEDYKKLIEAQIPATQEKRPDRRSFTGRNYSHLRAQMVGHSVQIPIAENKLQLGAWQEVVLFDFDDRICRREFFVLVTGEGGGEG